MSAGAERHLLFGLIALQVGLINPPQLVAAFAAWAHDKFRPLADHLGEQGALDTEGRTAIEAMVAVHLRKNDGDFETSLVSLPLGGSTRDLLAGLRDVDLGASLEHVISGSTRPDDNRTGAYSVGASTADGQRFRVLRPHAQGGLGAVFVALDGELNREVALKQILDSHADDPACRHRFLVEAKVTGGLEHPGIVPVYGLGVHADGRPFYAMRFIRGDSLKEAIDAFHRGSGAARGTSASGRKKRVVFTLMKPANVRWRSANCSVVSPTSATLSLTRTRGECSIATSSRATSSLASMAKPWSLTGDSPRRSAMAIRR